MWPAAFNFFLALLIFLFNVLVLVAICGERHLHTTTRLLSTNLWLCNCVSAIVTIFFSLNRQEMGVAGGPCVQSAPSTGGSFFPFSRSVQDSASSSTIQLSSARPTAFSLVTPSKATPSFTTPGTLDHLGAHSSAVLLNSSVSLLSLLAIGIVHALSTHNYRLSKTQSSRVLATTWLLALLLLLADFTLTRLSRTSLLALPFQLALLSVFLFLNLLLHPTNLILLSRCRPPQEAERSRLLEECTTSCLWLLLNSLSFVIIAMMVIWDVRNGKESDEHVLGIEMAAYSVHCIANPLIAIIRDRPLENAIARLLRPSKRQTITEDDLVVALMRDPPPPYST